MEKTIVETEVPAAPEKAAVEQPITEVDLSIFRSFDQALRVRTGNSFNEDVTKMLQRVENKTSVVFVKPEPEFEKKGDKRGWKKKPTYLKMDHHFLIVDEDKMEIICALSDGTTTFRNDRAKIKRSEGVDQMALKEEIENKVLSEYPQYKDYTIKHANLMVFPSKMNCSLRRATYEAKMIREFCIHVNYGLSSFRTAGRCHQIDAAMTIDELEKVIEELSVNKHKYSFDQDAFANAWKRLFKTMDYLPCRVLSAENAKDHKDELLYALEHHPNDYAKAELDEFAADCKICPWKKTMTNKAKLKAIRTFITNNF